MADSDQSDDLTILNEDGLLRRIPHWPQMYKFDNNTKTYRLTSANFKDPELSVSLEKDLLNDAKEHSYLVRQLPEFGLARIKAKVPRQELNVKQKLVRDPTPEDPYHAIVYGKKGKGDCRKLAHASKIVVEPKQPKEK